MGDLTLKATQRTLFGKKTKFLRRQGITPVHLFGHNLKSLALQCDTAQLQQVITRAGRTKLITLEIDGDKRPRSVLIREIQRDAITKELLHVDFYQVKKGEKTAVEVPIVFVGEAPAMKEKGRILTHGVTSLSIECLPDNVPSQIEVDLSQLKEAEQAIHVKDIVPGPDITITNDPDQLVVKVSKAAAERAEEAVEVEAKVPTEEGPAETSQPPSESAG
jgi:large subunit ribosomal protein L25